MRYLTLLFCLLSTALLAQPDTEIYLFDILKQEDGYVLKNQRNISNNPGYDSQPYFLGKNALVYAGTRGNATDIIQYTRGRTKVFNAPTEGGEYSPQPIQGGRGISAVRLDPDGKQRLYAYGPRKAAPKTLVKNAVVAYYTWANEHTIVAADIVGDALHLVIHDTTTGKNEDLGITVGRSFHQIPNTSLISFVDKTKEEWLVKSINPKSKKIKTIIALPNGIEDLTWMPDGSLLAAKDATIYLKKPKSRKWETFKTFEDPNLQSLSRITVSPDGSELALVSATSIVAPVDAHLVAYNNRDLEAFCEAFSEDVVMRNYPDKELVKGKDAFYENYKKWFAAHSAIEVKVLNRIVYKNFVIDEEKGITDGKEDHKAAIYEIKNGKIASMTFVWKAQNNQEDPIPAVEAQLKTYNAGDIDGFMSWYATAIRLFDFPARVSAPDKERIRETYADLFARMPDLNSF